jgi:hypothetical protein
MSERICGGLAPIIPQHCGIGFLDDSGGSSKPEDEGGSQPPVRAKVGATLVVIEVRSNYYERRSR